MRSFIQLAAVLLLCLVNIAPGPAAAKHPDDWNAAALAEASEALGHACALLEVRPQADWTAAETEQYLGAALNVVFHALIVEADRTGAGIPLDPNDIAHHIVIPQLPGNPFNGFAPMRFLQPGDAFSPGDLVLQVAPEPYWSNPMHPRPESFVLSVYGSTADCQPAQELNLSHHPWAIQPEGTLYTTMRYKSSVAERVAMIEKARAQRAAAPAE